MKTENTDKHVAVHEEATITRGLEWRGVDLDGKPVAVFVKQISLRDMDKLDQAQHNEADLIELVTGSPDLGDQLGDEALADLLEVIRQVNFTRLANWLVRNRRHYKQMLDAMAQVQGNSGSDVSASSAPQPV